MAATDQHYRKQRVLDVVFAVSSILMLLSLFWMFWQDYNREFKHVQRKFRDVEDEVFLRTMVRSLPDEKRLEAIDAAEQKLKEKKDELAKKRPTYDSAIRDAKGLKEIADAKAQSIKADYDSVNSLINIAQDDADHAADKGTRESLYQRVAQLKGQSDGLRRQLDEERRKQDEAQQKVNAAQEELKALEQTLAQEVVDYMLTHPESSGTQKPLMDYSAGQVSTLGDVEDNLKKVTGEFDRFAKLAAGKKWKFNDWFRNLPLIDAFQASTRIQQYTFNELTIDYSFKQVTRFDRCTSCHLGIDRASGFDKATLVSLKDTPEQQANNLKAALRLLKDRKKRGEDLGFDPGDIPGSLHAIDLKPSEVTQYCAHPHLDLFVDPNSPHPVEKMGCTICHGGQGSATDFVNAAHTPNSGHQKETWEKQHEWELGEFWDFPMLAHRFTEASCLKCHHQVTDLVRYGSKEDAPKLLRGYGLIRENGCFGCHEIAGQKSGRSVGPDLRLEPNVLPLEALTAAERTAARSDPLNPPGTFRKVGPSLYHIAEKTNEEWVRKWIRSPRGFRPDTKMPHFFGLSTNNHEYLAEEAKKLREAAVDKDNFVSQENFPDAEIYAIAYYLMRESKSYLEGKDRYRSDNLTRYKKYQEDEKREKELRQQLAAEGLSKEEKDKLQAELLKVALTEKKKKELDEVTNRLNMAGRYALLDKVLDGRITPEDAASRPDLIDVLPTSLAKEITDGEGNNVTEAYTAYVKSRPAQGDPKRLDHGNRLFREKGCLACHVHEAVKSRGKDEAGRDLPAIENAEADFGPNLSRLSAKLGVKPGDKESAHRWIVQWILNPKVYHPRTRMPITHLDVQQASDLADWLLAQDAGWNEPDVAAPSTETLKDLMALNLVKFLPKSEVERLKKEGFTAKQISEMERDRWEADELSLREMNDDNLKWYVGKRAINRLGCFGCHNIPGFESAKPIGTPLNDWGKKDPERLAWEDIEAYIKDQKAAGHVVEIDNLGKEETAKVGEGKEGYEAFFLDALSHHRREGFLHQKLMEPRSFDYHRPVNYDDRLRMPQFRFARGAAVKPAGEETKEQAEVRAEGEAREAVMTFVLGLVADPIPYQYLNRPTGDKLAEAKGRALLDTYNCVGCHQVRAGVYEFRRPPPPSDPADESNLINRLRNQAEAAKSTYAEDFFFPDHSAWVGGPQPSDRIRMHGIGAAGDENQMSVFLSQALRFEESLPANQSIRAGVTVMNLPASGPEVISKSEPYGGYLANLLTPYLMGRGVDRWNSDYRARHGLPPTLVREGERVQPEWLFRFLRHPTIIRPQYHREGASEKGMLALRMPRFNMSDEDAQNIVNYFAAVDRMDNPAFGVSYPYLVVPQHQENYLRERNAQYLAQLPKLKAEIEKAVLPAAEAAVKAAQTAEEKAPAGQKEAAKQARQEAEKDRDALKKLLAELPAKEKSPSAFAVDSYHLLTAGRGGACLECHSVGPLETKSPQGPPLDILSDRLRPEWTERWLANPKRLLTYGSFMPANYPRVPSLAQEKDQNLYPGMPLDHITALRDLLITYPKVAGLPEIRDYRPPQTAGDKKP